MTASDLPLHFQSATRLAAAVRAREISASDLLEHFISRIATHNPAINAIVWMNLDRARARAREADAALARGEIWGPLHGVPMTIKESFQWAGSPTNWGMPEWRENRPAETALVIEKLEQAGVVVFGKTNVPPMLADWQSTNPVYGQTNNPWNTKLVPGGSSGGSAAALAAGLTGCDAGSDIGASIRNPAHYCGVFGLKPTYGLLSMRRHAVPGGYAFADISAVGPMARSADDLDTMLGVMAGPDELEDACWRAHLPAHPATALKDFRIAVKLGDPMCEIDNEYRTKLDDMVRALRAAGATVAFTEPAVDTARLHELYVLLLRAATSARTPDADIARWTEQLAAVGKSAAPYLDQMVRGTSLSHRAWLPLDNERQKFRYAFREFFRDYDVLICPAASSAAWPHDQTGERWQRKIEVNGAPQATTDQLFWAGYSGVVYLPSVVGPAGITARGLPVGYQAIAAHGRDRTAIAFARAVEREIGGFLPPPGY
ncbi:MAG TPA: amidase [Hyphomicrobiaceae bacterium]|nr:amidase [Hyphomicrobiaceae bacterium]